MPSQNGRSAFNARLAEYPHDSPTDEQPVTDDAPPVVEAEPRVPPALRKIRALREQIQIEMEKQAHIVVEGERAYKDAYDTLRAEVSHHKRNELAQAYDARIAAKRAKAPLTKTQRRYIEQRNRILALYRDALIDANTRDQLIAECEKRRDTFTELAEGTETPTYAGVRSKEY